LERIKPILQNYRFGCAESQEAPKPGFVELTGKALQGRRKVLRRPCRAW